MTYLLIITLPPSPIPSQIPHTLFDIISLSVDAVLCHDQFTFVHVAKCCSTISWISSSWLIDWCFTAHQTKIGQFVPNYLGDYWLRRLRIANEEHTKTLTVACVTMNIHMQRQTTGMPYLLKDKQCIKQITRPRIGKKTQAGVQHLLYQFFIIMLALLPPTSQIPYLVR